MAAHLLTRINRYLVDVIGDAPDSADVPIGSRAYNLDDSLWYIFDGSVWAELTAETILAITNDQREAITLSTGPSGANVFQTESMQTAAIDAAITAALDNLLSALPTVDPAVAGALWNDNGVLTVSAG